jgi:hypothetical protein
MLCLSPLFGGEQEPATQDILSRHLASIGTAGARAAAKSRTVRASVRMTNLVGGNGTMEGSGLLVSLGNRFSIAMKFPDPNYPGEQFVFDGSKTKVGLIGPAKRSRLGDFLFLHDQILREGLFGGAMLTSWPLLDSHVNQARLKYNGLKKIDGRDLHELSYSPKKGDRDMLTYLYFEPDTFRHVKTVYIYEVDPSFGHNQLTHGTFTRYRIEEDFTDFKTVDGVTLPSLWKVRYSATTDTTLMSEWQIQAESITDNNVTE